MRIVILFLLNIAFNTTANLMIKQGMSKIKDLQISDFGGIIAKMILNPMLIFGCLFFGLSLFFYSFILQRVNLNIAYPIVVSGSVLLVTIISKIILFEPIKFTQLSGVLIILFGIFVLVR